MFVGEKLLSIVYNEYFTGGISVLKLPITLFVNREDVYKLAVKLFVNREDEEGAPSESGRTGAIGKNSKYKVCLDRHGNDHVVESRFFGATVSVSIRAKALRGPVSLQDHNLHLYRQKNPIHMMMCQLIKVMTFSRSKQLKEVMKRHLDP